MKSCRTPWFGVMWLVALSVASPALAQGRGEMEAVIVSPKNGSTVTHNEDLRGLIHGRGWPVVLVRPPGAQPWWVQPPVDDVINGKFSSPVYFGDETSPDGMRFKVIIL